MLPPVMAHLERRGDERYRFDQPLQFTVDAPVSGYRGARLGAGHSIELGAGGLLVHTEQPPDDGEQVEIQIAWPLPAQGVCPVVLVIQAIVVRTDARGTALRMRSYEFQMAGTRSLDPSISSGATCNLIG